MEKKQVFLRKNKDKTVSPAESNIKRRPALQDGFVAPQVIPEELVLLKSLLLLYLKCACLMRQIIILFYSVKVAAMMTVLLYFSCFIPAVCKIMMVTYLKPVLDSLAVVNW